MRKEFTLIFEIPENIPPNIVDVLGQDIELLMNRNFTWFQDVRWEIPYDPKIALMVEPS